MQEQRLMNHHTEIWKLNTMNSKSFFDLYKKIEPFFEKIDFQNSEIILAVSGGADSMLISSLILWHFENKSLPLNHVHIAHCNHKIRPESEDEAKFMSDFFSGLDFHLFERKVFNGDDENTLRNRRYSQFSSLQKETKADFVFLGHHLNDRVESTFLHLMRGAGMNGFLNMQDIQPHPLLPKNCKVCRPLLSTSKSDILKICKEIGLPYFEDRTNQDCTVSKRNRIRNQILNPLSEGNNFLQSFANVYSELEKCINSTEDNKLIIMPTFPLWHAEYSYKRGKDILTCDTKDIFQLWKNIGVKKQASFILLHEWKSWLNTGKNSIKHIDGVYFFIHEKELFIIKAEENFRLKDNSESCITVQIKDAEIVDFLGFDLSIPRIELIGGTIRLPEHGDIFAGKSWHRRALNQKIPMRWRDWIPLAIKDGKVIHMRKNIRK